MLEMDERRVSYIDQLRPDRGFELGFAVATTYSLDMSALLGICLSVTDGLSEDDPTKTNSVNLFSAAVRAKDRIAVFCEKGRIKNDAYTKQLCVLLEDAVSQMVVSADSVSAEGSHLASFHPKVWVAEFVNESTGERRYRLLVMSRNLTFDGSWDVAVRLDGTDAGRPVKSSREIARFLEYLADNSELTRHKTERVRALAASISNVQFEVDESQFEDFSFLPFGPSGAGLLSAEESAILSSRASKALIVSPFLGNTGVLEAMNRNKVVGKGSRFMLASRESELGVLNDELRNSFELYAPKPWLSGLDVEGNGENPVHTDIASEYSNLHAKMYLLETEDDLTLYLGSMNASRNGASRNVEAMLALRLNRKKAKFEKIVDELVGEEGKPFGRVSLEAISQPAEAAPAEAERERLQLFLHDAARRIKIEGAVVSECGDGAYSIAVELSNVASGADGLRLEIAPYLAKSMFAPAADGTMLFEGLRGSQVSTFFALIAHAPGDINASCLVCCPKELFDDAVLDEDVRTSSVLEQIIEREEYALERYIGWVFGVPFESGEGPSRQMSGRKAAKRSYVLMPGLYEKLLKSLCGSVDAKQRLDIARRMMSYIPDKYSEDQVKALEEMIDQFELAVNKNA